MEVFTQPCNEQDWENNSDERHPRPNDSQQQHTEQQCAWSSSGLEQITTACPYLLSQGGGLGMARGDCCVIPEQQVVHGSTHDLTATDHHSSLPCHLDTCTTESQERAKKRSLCSLVHTNSNCSGVLVSLSLALVLSEYYFSLLCVVGNSVGREEGKTILT